MLFNNPSAINSQYPRDQFANETPANRLLHRAIAWRHRQKKPREVGVINFRKTEMERMLNKRYGGQQSHGWQLPDDDAGRGDLRIMMDHLAQLGEDHMRRWANLRAPWLSDDDLDDLFDELGPGKYWTPTALGKALNLTNAERMRLNIRTIRPVDRTKAQLEQDCRERHAKAEAARRLKAGATPRAQSLSQTRPWKALGISRSTFERRQRR